MKLITSLVRPDRLDAVKRGLQSLNICGLTMGDVKDHSPQEHETTVWRGHEYDMGFSPKVQVQVVVHDDDVDRAIALIIGCARTGKAGDGYVCVVPIEHRYDIRTGYREVV
jgi:nitrogen regulatory protein P-II 1